MNNPDVTKVLPTPATSAPRSGSEAQCAHTLWKEIQCPKKATHKVARIGGELEWLMCEEHAVQRRGRLYEVTSLPNAEVSGVAAADEAAGKRTK